MSYSTFSLKDVKEQLGIKVVENKHLFQNVRATNISTPQNEEKTEKLPSNRFCLFVKFAYRTSLLLLLILTISILLRILYHDCGLLNIIELLEIYA